jgi:hypothetical protein
VAKDSTIGGLLLIADTSTNSRITSKIGTSALRTLTVSQDESGVRKLEIGYWGSTATSAYGWAANECGINSAVPLTISIADNAVAKFTATGLNNVAIGATTANSGLFTTIGATGIVSATNTTEATSGTGALVCSGGGSFAKKVFASLYGVGANQVVGARVTGYTAMTGTPDKATAYATSTVTLAQLAGRVAQLQADLTTHGLIGA